MGVNLFKWFRPPPQMLVLEDCWLPDDLSTFIKANLKIWNPENFDQRLDRLQHATVIRDLSTRQIVGCACIKLPFSEYKKKIFEKARVPDKRHQYKGEFGYVAVDKNYRKLGLGKLICNRAVAYWFRSPEPIYSIIDNHNRAMRKILISLDFIEMGTTFPSELEPHKMLTLYVKD